MSTKAARRWIRNLLMIVLAGCPLASVHALDLTETISVWGTIWLALGGNVAFLAVVAFLGKSVISTWLEKDLQRFKDRLASDSARKLEELKSQLNLTASTELERLKGNLTLIASEHSIMLSRLQDRRAQVIGELYAKLAIAIRLTTSFVSPMQWAGEPNQTDKANQAAEAINQAQFNFEENRIWLTKSCAASVEALSAELRSAFNQLAVWLRHQGDAAEERRTKAWFASWEAISSEKVPPALRALEDDMRQLLDPRATTRLATPVI